MLLHYAFLNNVVLVLRKCKIAANFYLFLCIFLHVTATFVIGAFLDVYVWFIIVVGYILKNNFIYKKI